MCADDEILLRGEIADLDVLVGAGGGDLRSILPLGLAHPSAICDRIASPRIEKKSYLGKVDIQDGLGVFVGVAALALAILGNLVDADLVIPARDGEEVGAVWRRGEGQVGDGISGRVGQGNVQFEIADGIARGRGRGGSKESRHCCGRGEEGK